MKDASINKAAVQAKYCSHYDHCQHRKCLAGAECSFSVFMPIVNTKPDKLRIRGHK